MKGYCKCNNYWILGVTEQDVLEARKINSVEIPDWVMELGSVSDLSFPTEETGALLKITLSLISLEQEDRDVNLINEVRRDTSFGRKIILEVIKYLEDKKYFIPIESEQENA